jgi:2-polyprenyl-3-methyl-5-hydroxy-6-metoxy-1,4-benzoquinol methylase
MEGDAYKFICNEILKETPSFHRKQWEFVYILDMLNLHNKLKPGNVGLGFGCGKERLVPAMAAMGVDLTVTDLSFDEAKIKGWTATNQHSGGLEDFIEYCPTICTEDQLMGLTYRTVDMNNISLDLMQMGFDFVWSSCSLEHLGTLDKAKQFIYSTMHCLKPGGILVHTTEFNLSSNTETMESGATVLFRERDIFEVAYEVNKLDGFMCSINLDPGNKELDYYIDLPPYLGNEQRRHLKLLIDKYNCTSIGICIKRKG